ncbi:MAG: signal peptidase I, partial [Leptotrichia sp.]|nr:signal peptidase I [Leptotrichia sp.]
MKILLWVIFYLITSVFLLYFFVREKKVIGFIRKKEDDVLKKVPLQSDGKNITLGNILTLVALVVTALFFVLVDKTYDQTIVIKIWGVYGIFILNLVFYVMKKEHEWIFLGNLVMMLLGRLMFNILDPKYYVYLAINVVLSLILVYLFRKPAEEKINEKTILKEIANAKSEDEYLLDNSISMEDKIEITKVRRSS